jgi:hypothetical protein
LSQLKEETSNQMAAASSWGYPSFQVQIEGSTKVLDLMDGQL